MIDKLLAKLQNIYKNPNCKKYIMKKFKKLKID